MTGNITVLVVDDQQVVREGLALVLGLLPGVEVVGSAMDGAEATRRLREQVPESRVVVLTTYSDERSVIDALRAGARGYLTKDAGGAEIHAALRSALDDRAALDPAVQRHLVEAIAADPPRPERPDLPDGLTPREGEVLGLIAEGLSNSEIARRPVTSEGTVTTHVNRVLAKTGNRDRAQAVAYAYRRGLAG